MEHVLITLAVAALFYTLYNRKITKLEARRTSLLQKLSAKEVEAEQRYQIQLGLEKKIKEIEAENTTKDATIKKIVHQKKSSEVRTGQIAEQMAPFLEGFPFDPKRVTFMGQPIDFIAFEDDGVYFLEVKSGNSQLNKAQRRIRDQIKGGHVFFDIYRIKGE